MTYEEIIEKLKSLANPKNVEGMARFGINAKNTLGVSGSGGGVCLTGVGGGAGVNIGAIGILISGVRSTGVLLLSSRSLSSLILLRAPMLIIRAIGPLKSKHKTSRIKMGIQPSICFSP